MSIKRVQKKIAWTEQDRARHKAIRETFKDKPSVEELSARGELTGQGVPLGVYLSLRVLVKSLRKMREEAQVSLADVSARCGMDKATLSRLENGHVPNPGIETICRYLSALEKGIEWRIVPAPTAPIGKP
jgi:DNA-binding Xre family transcriptional regulator